VLPGMQGIFLKQASRDLELTTAMKGGVKQGRKPSWNFTGDRHGANDPVTVADRSPEIAGADGYNTTMTPWVDGDKQAREILNLTEEDGEQAAEYWGCILRHCFRELDTMDEHE